MEREGLYSVVFCLNKVLNLISIVIYHCRILAPTAYIFFASVLPVIAFGEQLSRETGQFELYRTIDVSFDLLEQ